MLTRTRFFGLALAAVAVQAVACVVTTTEDDGIGGFGASTSDATTTVTSTTTNTVTSTTTTTTATTTSTGTGGCVGPAGTGVTEDECDNMGWLTQCPDDGSEPQGLSSCHRGFQLFLAGPWEDLQHCLTEIPVTIDDLCGGEGSTAETNVQNCINTMYADACSNQNAIDKCNEIAASCTDPSDVFNTANCQADLNPFSNDGINEYLDCVNASGDVTCADLEDHCLGVVFGTGG